ncbi:hypothetical protein E2P81_ATG03163 [Venturia nashicola]|uniref:Uncharacterized protein n=1 Tax=Venturia nashicola TaxID=86259 RepID=A0A4Z1P765_9PEZI|nr:hypothetical protein E6O75_ATG03234 [Venturia nashicola]TLD36274.1 hypothetical protein E2P81_ATG03163 [Venturia nashicola]
MLPPAFKHGSQPQNLLLYHPSVSGVRHLRLNPAISILQTRTYFGRRHRDEHRGHADQKRLRNYNYNEESDPTEELYARRDSAQNFPDPIPPKPNHKEHIWQQRMDYIRKALEQDPYEALFGNSNRLLGRSGRRDWPLDITNLWRNQAERASTWRKQMSSWRVDILRVNPAQAHSSRTDLVNSTAPTIAVRTETNNMSTPTAASSTEVDSRTNDEHIEYDPISGRMMRKIETGFSHYSQDLNAAVDVPIKQFKPTETAATIASDSKSLKLSTQRATNTLQTSLDRYTATPKLGKQGVGYPLQTSLDRYAQESQKDLQPSFTMLKEDPIKVAPPDPQLEAGKSKVDESAPINPRAEYDQYKAARLPPAKFSRDDWLIQEGFINTSARSSDSSEGKINENRLKLEGDFDEVRSTEKEMAENPVNKPWKSQTSKSTITELSPQEQESAKTMSQWLGDEWTTEELRQQELEALNPKATEDANASKIEMSQGYIEPGTRHIKLAPESEITKAEDMAAMNEIMDYNIQVARDNMKNKEANAKKDIENNRTRVAEAATKPSDYQVAEIREKTEFISQVLDEGSADTREPSTRHVKLAQQPESTKAEEAAAMNEIMGYHMAVAKDNMKNEEANAKKEMANNRARMAETLAKARADVDVMQYQTQVARANLKSREVATQKETVDYRARIAEAIEEARAHAQILDLNFSKMGHLLRASHIRKLKDAKENIQILTQKLEETRKAEYQAQSVQKQAADLKEVQGASVELARLAGEFEAKSATDGSRSKEKIETEGKGTKKSTSIISPQESRVDERLPDKSESAKLPALIQDVRGIPSLAEFFGYTQKKDENAALVKPVENTKLTKAQLSLIGESADQKAAMNALETSPTGTVPRTTSSPTASAWPVLDRTEPAKTVDETDSLTRRLRTIYEAKYGKITTAPIQPLVDSCNPNLIIAPPVEPQPAAPVPEVASAPIDTPDVVPATKPISTDVDTPVTVPAVAPKMTPIAAVSEPATSPAANKSQTPIDSRAVPYTLLAYDSQTQTITRASFTSPPQSSETTIPLTLALKDLHQPAKFLPLVQELRLKGYEPVHGERNMLILRQMQGSKSGVDEALVVETLAAKDEPRPRLPSWGATSGPRRTEEVFSGAQRDRGNKKERKGRKRAWRRAVRRLALGVAAVGGTIYVAGVMAEMTKIVVS